MSTNEMGIETARKHLGDLADAAYHRSETTILTRHGRQIAAIVPMSLVPQEPAVKTMTAQELAYAVSVTMGDHAGDFDIDAIVEEIRDTYGPVDIDAIDSDEYWTIIKQHDTSTVTLYETNSDILVIGRGKNAWTLGAPHGDYLDGTFAADAKAWLDGDWEPNVGDGQTSTHLDDLAAVATWGAVDGLQVLVDSLGGAARIYVGTALDEQ